MTADLPIDAVLPDIAAALTIKANAVIVAPPGAGKTTRVPPMLLDQPWATGAVWLLSPRRLSARAAAERIAAERGEAVGRAVGYATRLDSNLSADTRLLVMTPGLFRTRILADPELAGVAAVIFDEVHERSLDGDFALALAIDAQQGFRADLRLIAMSATLDGARFAALLGDCPVVQSEGRTHPLTLRYLGRRAEQPLEDAMLAAVRQAVQDEAEGDILAFLPGVGEIERAARRIADSGPPLAVHRLHGQIDPELQRAALRAAAPGTRKLILATSIAETSLTIDGVRIVIDAGLARRPRFDHAAGLSRLVTERASQAAATQRAGRAARQRAGVAYRLWEEAATGGMLPFDPPEIHENDLMPVVLDCASWGIVDPRQLGWLDPPKPNVVEEARRSLRGIGALSDDHRITPMGAKLAAIPLPVPLAGMLLHGAAAGQATLAAQIAVLLTEPGLGGRSPDIEVRLRSWTQAKGERAEGAWRLARRLARMAQDRQPVAGGASLSIGALVALAWPDRLARARSGQRGEFLGVGGRAYRIDPADALAGSEWLAVADAQGQAQGVRILAAAAITAAEVEAYFADAIEVQAASRYDTVSDRVDHRRAKRLGAITLVAGQDAQAHGDRDADVAIRLAAVATQGLGLIGWGDKARNLRQRAGFAGIVELESEHLLATTDLWLAPLLHGCRGLRDMADDRLAQALLALLPWDRRQHLERVAPPTYRSPAGADHLIDYGAEGGPRVDVRVQELFGLDQHPTVGQPSVPLVLALTSPAHRPIQMTRDLPSFWRGSWADVARDMRGRYPKHVWPDVPQQARPTLLTKAAQARRDGD